MLKYIKLLLKKQKLLKKYKRTSEKMEKDLYLLNIMKDDKKFESYYLEEIHRELRCYRRLKKLK